MPHLKLILETKASIQFEALGRDRNQIFTEDFLYDQFIGIENNKNDLKITHNYPNNYFIFYFSPDSEVPYYKTLIYLNQIGSLQFSLENKCIINKNKIHDWKSWIPQETYVIR